MLRATAQFLYGVILALTTISAVGMITTQIYKSDFKTLRDGHDWSDRN